MMHITKEVSKLQEEIMALKTEKLTGMLEELELEEEEQEEEQTYTGNVNHSDMEDHSCRYIKSDNDDLNCIRNGFDPPASPVLKKRSSYHESGKLRENGTRRYIVRIFIISLPPLETLCPPTF
jgi:hypothetical protein